MQATADSRTVNAMGEAKEIMALNFLILNKEFPNKDIKRWPAIKLAVKRTQSVIGRIILLTISIMTINIIRRVGVPWGKRCASICLVFLIHPNIIKDSQKVRDKGRVITNWEVGENVWGYSAKKFKVIIDKNVTMIIASLPFCFLPRVKATSFLNVPNTFIIEVIWGEIFFHSLRGINNAENKTIAQAIDMIELLGSKTENRLVIIVFSFLF